MKYLSLIPLIGCLLCSCSHEKIPYLKGSIQDIFAKAQVENKKVFVLIGNSTCGQCKHFDSLLGQQATTVDILNKEYLCYKVDIHDSVQKTIAQITKCPSYPFPYFFDKDGNLEAFGFPNTREYDISDLSKIDVDEYRFKELFHLPITTSDYKSLVSLNLRAFLLANKATTEQKGLDSAYKMVSRSLDIAAYPFNLWLSYQLANRLGYKNESLSGHETASLITSQPNDSLSYSFTKGKLECGSVKRGTDYAFAFEFRNTGKKELVIARAEHPCSCIELTWPPQAIRPGKTGLIQGVFHAREQGRFSKDIFVHATSSQIPMKTVVLTGTVF
jgi:hypothetical protein